MYQCVMGKSSTSIMDTLLKSQYLRNLSSQYGGTRKQDDGESPFNHKSPTPIFTPSSSTDPQYRNLSTVSCQQRRYWSIFRYATPAQLHRHQRKQFATSTSSPVLNALSATSMWQHGSQPNIFGSRASATVTA